jgi:prepilin-type N-terminal cleavage/methylation domain-containing protein
MMYQKKNILKRNNAGFSLLECIFAIVILTVGLLAVAALASVAVKRETFAYKTSETSTLAASKIEEIKAGTLVIGGSLTSDVTGYSDIPNFEYSRRWQIIDGPSGTKQVTVKVFHQIAPQAKTAQIVTLIR